MNQVKILVQGYASKTKNGWLASSTATLIQTGKHKIIVDPGINRKTLLEKLGKENLSTNDIDYVFLTHYHLDHTLLTALFENATVFDGSTIYRKDDEIEYSNVLPDTDIRVVPTPGHANEHASLIVKTEDLGTVAIAADVFWWTKEEEQITEEKTLIEKRDPFVQDVPALIESRKQVLKIANWIIPGHGKMFQVKNVPSKQIPEIYS